MNGPVAPSGPDCMNDDLRESRGALILLGAAVLSVLVFGAVTLLGLSG